MEAQEMSVSAQSDVASVRISMVALYDGKARGYVFFVTVSRQFTLTAKNSCLTC
jgi:hypothetical protein